MSADCAWCPDASGGYGPWMCQSCLRRERPSEYERMYGPQPPRWAVCLGNAIRDVGQAIADERRENPTGLRARGLEID